MKNFCGCSLGLVLFLALFGQVHSQALGADCHGTSTCDTPADHVCENDGAGSQLCKVKADGVKTDCASTNGNCPAHATCATTVCNCDAGWLHDGSGLCTVQNADCSSAACGDTTNYVCDTTTDTCEVKADGVKTDCASSNGNCPAHSTCATTVCNCDAGWLHDGSGLCTVQNADCSSAACGDTTNYVCDTTTDTCEVKADGVKTDCASTNGNCPAHATCATTVCNCDAGWLHDGSGLCTVQNADCSSATCGDTTNYVCDASTNTCEVQADGAKTDCASNNGNCPAHATCATTVCNCDAGWINDGTGLCTVQNADCSSDACGDTTNYVCDTSTNTCEVQADGVKTNCASTDGNCPAHATCATTVCNCDAGWINDGTGLCTVQNADCSSDACGDTTNYVCDTSTSTCEVKADGAKTDCASTNGNCPAHATCATTVCNCDAGWLHDGSGLCTVQNADCSSAACGDTTNFVCDTSTDTCEVQADGVKTDCASDNGNCPAHASCATTVCNCDAGWINDGTGLCTVQNADCSSATCGDTTNYVCDTSTSTCEVQADGVKTDCASTTANCPAHATCATTVCNCDAGWINDGTGLCTVQNADCSSAACGDTTNYVCDTSTNTCEVQADGVKTDCVSTNGNCPAHATCTTNVCNCDAGWINDGTGLCTVQNADCSSATCGDTTNYVCDTSTNACGVKADGAKTDCASTNGNCPAHATCATTVCNCDAGWLHDGSGLCIVQNADCSSATCGDTTNYVCDTSSNTCEVQADGVKTDCGSTNGNCPAHATCATTVCNCDAGYVNDGTGLCTVQNADCSSATCGDTTNYVCDTSTNTCEVKADGAKTDCASTNGNCPAHATCATTVCNCDAGWLHDGSGLCTVQNAVCSSAACGDTTNFVCDTSTNTCEVKADGVKTDCASTNGNCPAHATCATTVCNCDAGYVNDGTGLCTVQNADCSSATCGDTTNFVCDTTTNTCEVKADGAKTDCASTDANCPAHATCATTVCNCDAGWTQDGTTGLCTAIVGMTCSGNSDCTTLDSNSECSSLSCACVSGYTNTAGGACSVQDATCSSTTACTDSTNYICDTSSNKCKVRADGTATDCLSTDSFCPANAACSGTTTCSCDSGYTVNQGLCVSGGLKLTAYGFGVYLCILLISFLF